MELSKQNIYQVISANLIRFRCEKRYTQLQVATMLQVSQPTYHRLETGDSPIGIHHLDQLAGIYGRPIADFFGGPPCSHPEFLALQREHADLRMKYEQLERTARLLFEGGFMPRDSSGTKR